MNLKLKILGLSCLTALAAGALVVVNAGATAGGHFTSNRALTTLEVIEQGSDTLEFFAGATKAVHCQDANYHGWFAGTTVTAFTLTPEYKECLTTGGKVGGVTITTHGCFFEFTVRPDPENKHNTMHIKCPSKKITIVDTEAMGGSCTTEIGPQTVEGVVYKKTSWQGTESLTAEFTVKKIQYTLHNGMCSLLFGTTHNDGELKGSFIIKAWNTENTTQGADIQAT